MLDGAEGGGCVGARERAEQALPEPRVRQAIM